MRVDGQEPGTRRERRTSGPLTAKSVSIKDAKRRSSAADVGWDFPTGSQQWITSPLRPAQPRLRHKRIQRHSTVRSQQRSPVLFQPSTNEDASKSPEAIFDKRSIGVDQGHHPRQRPAFGRDHADQGFLPIHLRARCTDPNLPEFSSTNKLQAFLWPGLKFGCGLQVSRHGNGLLGYWLASAFGLEPRRGLPPWNPGFESASAESDCAASSALWAASSSLGPECAGRSRSRKAQRLLASDWDRLRLCKHPPHLFARQAARDIQRRTEAYVIALLAITFQLTPRKSTRGGFVNGGMPTKCCKQLAECLQHGKQGRDREPVNDATGHIDIQHDRESRGSPSSSARGSVRKDRILATEFLTRQRSNAQPSSSSWAFKAAALGLRVCGVFAPAKAAGAAPARTTFGPDPRRWRMGGRPGRADRRAERRGRVASLCGP